MGKYTHRQVKVQYLNGTYTTVDEKLKPLLKELWKRGIRTINSCQENFPGIAWIQFQSSEDAAVFIKMAWALADEDNNLDMKWRIDGSFYDIDGNWRYETVPAISGKEGDIFPDTDVEIDILFPISIRFPVPDLEYLTRKLTATRKEKRCGSR